MMRHTKSQRFNGRKPLLELPRRRYETILLEFEGKQAQVYQSLFQSAKRRFEEIVARGDAAHHTISFLSMLAAVRQVLLFLC
jgi:hypothetical protein